MTIQTNMRRSIHSFAAGLLLMASTAVFAEKTISYYSENAGERIDRVLACRDGAEDPMSLGCRNANEAQEIDRLLVHRKARAYGLANFSGPEVGVAKEPGKRAYQVMELISMATRSSNCVPLDSGKPPSSPQRANIYKVALAEKLIEPVAGKADVYRATKRGVEFLASQGDGVQNGFFCPVGLTYGPRPQLLEQHDLSEQYQGPKKGFTITKLRVQKIAFDLTNTGSSTWFLRKLLPVTLPMSGKAVVQYITVEYQGRKGEFAGGGVYEIDGKATGGPTLNELLAIFK